MGADPRAQTRTSESDGIGNDARAPRPHGAGFIFTRRKRPFPDGFVGKGIGRHQVRSGWITGRASRSLSRNDWVIRGLRVKMCVWLGVSRGLDLAFLNAD